jgi:hypothetical protein
MKCLVILSKEEVLKHTHVVGVGSAGVYSSKSAKRAKQWKFEENRHRALWIDYMAIKETVQKSGLGKVLLTTLVEFLKTKSATAERKNIYVLAADGSHSYYRTHGFEEVRTESSDDDEDYIWVFNDEHHLRHYALPIGAELDAEKYSFKLAPTVCCLLRAIEENRDLSIFIPFFKEILSEEEEDMWLYNGTEYLTVVNYEILYRYLHRQKYNTETTKTLEEIVTSNQQLLIDAPCIRKNAINDVAMKEFIGKYHIVRLNSTE